MVFLVLGIVLGIASSVPPGPCGLAILSGVSAGGSQRRAVATALGGALADVVYATLGVIGIAPLLAPWTALLQAISGVVLIGYGGAKLLERPMPRRDDHPGRGLGVGFALVIGNPAALITWVLVVGSRLGAASPAERACTVAGIGLGTFAWFCIVARLARGRDRLARISAMLGAVLVCVGAVTLARAAEAVFG
jgi:threonine/homoserine/homoserine lactone efflux protein